MIKKNDVIKLNIDDMSLEGAGIGHADGMTIFVKDAVVGDEVEAIITKVKKSYCFATVKNVTKPSIYRVEPKCAIARQCGGCQIMQIDYTKQLEIKNNIVKNNLIKIGGFDKEQVENVMEPIMGMEEPFRYRNKAQVPIGYDKDGNLIAGFYGARSHRIVATEDCKICSTLSMEIARAVIRYMEENGIRAYDETTGKGLIRHVLVREGKATNQTMVCIVVNGDVIPKKEKLVEEILKTSDVTSIVININTRRDNVIMGYETKPIYGPDFIRDEITLSDKNTIAFDISANSFYQVNHDQMEKLYSKALEYADLTGEENLWDLYCGIGTISLSMAKHAKNVYGVEVIPQAIENAKNNARLNGLDNAKFFCGEAEVVLPDFYNGKDKELIEAEGYVYDGQSKSMNSPDVIVVDPPRKGCEESALKTMLQMKPKRIVYVSCDSATLARDLKYLVAGGYSLEKVTAVDQFGHTMHVESVVQLKRVEDEA